MNSPATENPCLVNLTPHAIRFRWGSSTDATPTDRDRVFESEGLARIASTSEPSEDIRPDGDDYHGFGHQLPCVRMAFGEPTGLPEPRDGVWLIVSLPLLSAMAGRRTDLVAPDTGPDGGAIRDGKGQVFAVRRFVRM